MRDYKKIIENMLNDDNMKDRKNIIEKMLKNDYEVNKITEEEYNEYREFFKQKVKEMEEKKVKEILENQEKESSLESKPQDKITAIQQREEFKRKMRVEQMSIEEKKIDFIPIYKGKMGELPPKRQKEDNQREAR